MYSYQLVMRIYSILHLLYVKCSFINVTGFCLDNYISFSAADFESFSNALRMIRHVRWFEEETAHLKRCKYYI